MLTIIPDLLVLSYTGRVSFILILILYHVTISNLKDIAPVSSSIFHKPSTKYGTPDSFINFKNHFHTATIYKVLELYLTNRTFFVNYQEATTTLRSMDSGIPKGSILGSDTLSSITSDLPKTNVTVLATYADDTIIMASHKHPDTASRSLQKHLDNIQFWLKTWRISVNT